MIRQRYEYLRLKREDKIREARNSFRAYCRIKRPKFFTEDKKYLQDICDTLQALYEGRIIKYSPEDEWIILDEPETITPHIVCKKLIINTPPRFGKTSTLVLFGQWTLGKNPDLKEITVSYNEKLSGRFGRDVRNGIDETKVEDETIIYNDIFPETRIKYGDSSYLMWSLEGKHFNYLATSFNATVTGVGADILLIDDPIKNHIEAYNVEKLDQQYDYYTDTLLPRLEEGALQVIDMTRWAKRDLCGRLEKDGDWFVIKYEAMNMETDEMLCAAVLSKATYESRKDKMSTFIFMAIYHARPIDLEGTVYTYFRNYSIEHVVEEGIEYIVLKDIMGAELKRISNESGKKTKFDLFEKIISYTDTADEGDDYLCSIAAGVLKSQAFLLAVVCTDKPMEVTEGLVARMFYDFKVKEAKIESNKGGKAFSRTVERLLLSDYNSKYTGIEWFHQSQNKIARILSNSSFVMRNIYYPFGWEKKWPAFCDMITTFQKEGENQHDDAPDALTGIAEMLQGNERLSDESKQTLKEYLEQQKQNNL